MSIQFPIDFGAMFNHSFFEKNNLITLEITLYEVGKKVYKLL